MNKEFKINDKVFHIYYGWGIITEILSNSSYPIKVVFNKTSIWFTEKGYLYNNDVNPSLSHTEYSINSLPQERVIEVKSVFGQIWKKRVLIAIKHNRAICWANAETIEASKSEISTTVWECWREVQEEQIVELTLEDISNGEGVGVPAHLLRIKK